MMELRYALKNLIKAIKNKPLSFVLTEVYILVSVLALFFCYGIAGNYELLMRQSDAAYEEKCVYIQFNEDIYTDGSSASLAEVNEFLAGLQAVTQLDMKIVSSYILVGGNVIDISYGFDGGAFTYPEYKADNFSRNNWLMSGRYFTEEEFKQGKKVVVIPDIIQYGDLYSYDSERNSIILDGEEYSVIGILDCPFIDLPVTSVKEETIVQDMLIEMKHIVTKDEYTDIKNNVRQMFGDAAYFHEMNFDVA